MGFCESDNRSAEKVILALAARFHVLKHTRFSLAVMVTHHVDCILTNRIRQGYSFNFCDLKEFISNFSGEILHDFIFKSTIGGTRNS